MEPRTIVIGERSARVWTGGEGEVVVLLHGGWGGAEAFWSTVWNQLAERFHVVAPELPGVMTKAERPLQTFGAYARWLEDILDVLGIRAAWIVGNSFGASVAWRFASQAACKCRGLVMVNGFPPPTYPAVLRWAITRTFLRRPALAYMRRITYSPAALKAAFYDPQRAPAEIVRLLTQPSQAQIKAAFNVVLSGEAPCQPPLTRTLVLWGEDDHLPMVDVNVARRLSASLRNSELVLLHGAGHLPQVERPDEFVQSITQFINRASGGSENESR